MKKFKLAVVIAIVVLLLSIPLAGCATGIPQEQYNSAVAQLQDAQAKLADLQSQINNLQAQKDSATTQLAQLEASLKAAQGDVARLNDQVKALKAQYELAGATPAETAEKIVKYYHETHIYSKYDLFICSDMASEIWNMLKAQGISALVVVGDIDNTVSDIVLSDHAWVLAEVSPGEYLALETTGGFAVPRSQNVLYYQGWSFKSPADLKNNNDWVREYNVRVEILNQMIDEENQVVAEHNKAASQSEADKLKAVYDELQKIIAQQKAELDSLLADINQLATKL